MPSTPDQGPGPNDIATMPDDQDDKDQESNREEETLEQKAERMTEDEIMDLFPQKIDEWADFLEQAESARKEEDESEKEALMQEIDLAFEETASKITKLVRENYGNNYQEPVSPEADRILREDAQKAIEAIQNTPTGRMTVAVGQFSDSARDFARLVSSKRKQLHDAENLSPEFLSFARSLYHHVANRFSVGVALPHNNSTEKWLEAIALTDDLINPFGESSIDQALEQGIRIEGIEKYIQSNVELYKVGLKKIIEKTHKYIYDTEPFLSSEARDDLQKSGGKAVAIPDSRLTTVRSLRDHKEEIVSLTKNNEEWPYFPSTRIE